MINVLCRKQAHCRSKEICFWTRYKFWLVTLSSPFIGRQGPSLRPSTRPVSKIDESWLHWDCLKKVQFKFKNNLIARRSNSIKWNKTQNKKSEIEKPNLQSGEWDVILDEV